MEYYALAKHLHMTVAMVSVLGFVLRGYWMITENPLLQSRPSRILPHIVDTVLLLSAIYLFVITQLYPFTVGWVTAKLLLMIAYIGVGTVAIKRGKTKTIRVIALVIATAIVLSIFVIAFTKPAF